VRTRRGRTALKIRFPERGVSVRARPPILVNFLQRRHKILYSKEVRPKRRTSYYTNGYTNRLVPHVFHRRGVLIPHVGKHVGVRVQGNSYRGMTEHLGAYLGFTVFDRSKVAHVCRRS
jgi:hypothetical protein